MSHCLGDNNGHDLAHIHLVGPLMSTMTMFVPTLDTKRPLTEPTSLVLSLANSLATLATMEQWSLSLLPSGNDLVPWHP